MDNQSTPINRRQTCWQTMTRREKFFFFMLTAFMGTTLILFIALLSQKSKGNGDDSVNSMYKSNFIRGSNEIQCKNEMDKVCVTSGCIKASAQILSSMDFAIDPCEDFYKFVCGNYLKTETIPEDQTMVHIFSVINNKLQEQIKNVLEEPILNDESKSIQKAKKFYQSCMNKKEIENRGFEEGKDILDSVGGWPVIDGREWEEDEFNWMKSIISLRSIGSDSNLLINVAIGMDSINSSRRIITIDQPALGLSRELLLDEKKNFSGIYLSYMVDVAKIFGAYPSTAVEELKLSLEFEKKLAEFSLAQEDRRDSFKLYNRYTLSELKKNWPGINWFYYINNSLLTSKVTEDEVIIVTVPDYLDKLHGLIKITPKRVLANYIMWRTIKNMIPYLSDDLVQRELEYNKLINGISQRPPRWKECVHSASESIPALVGSLYVRRYVHDDTKKKVVEIVKYLREAFSNILKSVDWMEEKTREEALEKVQAITEHIAYPDELLDDKKLDQVFNDELVVYDDKYLRSYLNIEFYLANFNFGRLRQKVNKTEWIDHAFPAYVNAYYHWMENSIIFPAGILQNPFFDKDRPFYLNFGAIGSVIGHEITHGFDDLGKQFNKDGNLANWWAKDTQKMFLQKAQCIIEQYGNYSVNIFDQVYHLNGKNTQGENIADNGGLKEAYLAYDAWVMANEKEPLLPGLNFSQKQLFWISAASNWCTVQRPEHLRLLVSIDSHSPGEFRVLGPMSNLKYFSEDFNCPLGSPMNPQSKCAIW